MKKHWWKLLGVLLLVYSFTVGMLVPLKPGITDVTPSSVASGQEITLKITGYNTHFKDAQKSIRVWLKTDVDHAIEAGQTAIKSNTIMAAEFEIPKFLPSTKSIHECALIVDNDIDGASVLPTAVFLKQTQIDSLKGSIAWSQHKIDRLHKMDGITFPFRNILAETIRNTYYHVPFWFAMMIIFTVAAVYSWKYLKGFNAEFDRKAVAFTKVGILYGLLGLATGAIWAKNTWGAYWSFDIKQNMAAIAILIYLAYFVLRSSFEVDNEKRSRISAVYNIFAFSALIPLLFVIPRFADSLHPGSGGNPGFGGDDLDNTMRLVLYPAVIGWLLLGCWMANISYRMETIKEKLYSL